MTEQSCRNCGGKINIVLDLGSIYPSGFVKEQPPETRKYPLALAECEKCGLIQLNNTFDLDEMYKKQYWYSSSLNRSMVSSLRDVIRDVESKVDLKDRDVVLDIGANDCTLLDLYSNKSLYEIGFDPAPNLEKKNGCEFINDYFTSDEFVKTFGNKKAKVITAIAMFYDLPDPNKFVEDVKTVLADDGIFVIQFTDLLSMYKATAFDNICHEHLEYYRLLDVVSILRKHGLIVTDVSYNDVNGGSLRVTACHDGAYLPKPSVVSALTKEKNFLKEYGMEDFKNKVEEIKFTISDYMKFAKECNCDIKTYLFGASTKGNTLLQICGITDKEMPYALEVNKDKFGLRTIGSNIEIISEDDGFSNSPDALFVAIWHFKESILKNPKIIEFINTGGHLIFPLPEFHIIGKEDLA